MRNSIIAALLFTVAACDLPNEVDSEQSNLDLSDDRHIDALPEQALLDLVDDLDEQYDLCAHRHEKTYCSVTCDTFSAACRMHHGAGHWDCTTCTPAGCITTAGHDGCPL